MYTSRPMHLPAAYASVVFPTPGLPKRRGFMGRSWSFTTIQAASNWRMSSSCPTHETANSSGWARCRLTPSISTVISYHHYAHNGMRTTGDLCRGSGDASDYDSMHLNQQLDFLPRNLERCRNPFRCVA